MNQEAIERVVLLERVDSLERRVAILETTLKNSEATLRAAMMHVPIGPSPLPLSANPNHGLFPPMPIKLKTFDLDLTTFANQKK